MGLALEFFWWSVAQRRVQLLAIVIHIHELGNVTPQMFKVVLLVGVDLFAFQRFDKAFATGVVIRVRGPTHARELAVPFHQGHVVGTGVLKSSVGMVHQAWLRIPDLYSLFERPDRQPRRQGAAQGPAHYPSGVPIQDYSQIDKFRLQRTCSLAFFCRTQILAEEREYVVLKTIRDGAGVRAVIILKAVGYAVVVEEIV